MKWLWAAWAPAELKRAHPKSGAGAEGWANFRCGLWMLPHSCADCKKWSLCIWQELPRLAWNQQPHQSKRACKIDDLLGHINRSRLLPLCCHGLSLRREQTCQRPSSARQQPETLGHHLHCRRQTHLRTSLHHHVLIWASIDHDEWTNARELWEHYWD